MVLSVNQPKRVPNAKARGDLRCATNQLDLQLPAGPSVAATYLFLKDFNRLAQQSRSVNALQFQP